MTTPVLQVILPGAFTTFQDLGRPGYQNNGVSPGGAMDRFAAQAANILVGNKASLPVMEVTLLGPRLLALVDTTISIAGADFNVTVGDKIIRAWSSFAVSAGDTISFGERLSGARAYLALIGGFDLPMVLGSCSTDVRLKIGGIDGRPLRSGEMLAGGRFGGRSDQLYGGRHLLPADIEKFYPIGEPIRVIRSAQNAQKGDLALQQFFENEYIVRPDSDRMGYRFDGDPIETHALLGAENWSEPTAEGTVQIPPSGQPMVLMADRQTVGGYPKIGTVCTVDLNRLAQSASGDTLRFAPIDLNDALRFIDMQRRFLQTISIANA